MTKKAKERINPSMARTFIIRYPKLKEDYTLKRQLFRGGVVWTIASVSVILFLWFVSAMEGHYLSGAAPLVMFGLLISLPAKIVLSIVLLRKSVLKSAINTYTHRSNSASIGGAFGAFGASLAVLTTRLFPPSEHIMTSILLLASLVVTAMLFSYIATYYFYRLHLLIKYCPELANETDMEALRDKYGVQK